jgi:hypothetical protein
MEWNRWCFGNLSNWANIPSIDLFETQIGYNMVKAAVDARKFNGIFKHFVYSAVIYTLIRKLLNHEAKRYVEE